MGGRNSCLTGVVFVALAMAIAAGCNSGESPTTASGIKPAVVVLISDHPAEFEPQIITIRAGDTVEWRNTGGISHSVEFLGGQGPEAVSLSSSHLMIPGGSYMRTFTAPGTYLYGCRFHLINGMAGKIVVRPRR